MILGFGEQIHVSRKIAKEYIDEYLNKYSGIKEFMENIVKIAEEKGENFIEDAQMLITDIEMPQMDGLTLTRKVKEHNILKNIPVVIFSSLITDELRHKGESVGADAQLSKPEVEQLIGVVDKLLNK